MTCVIDNASQRSHNYCATTQATPTTFEVKFNYKVLMYTTTLLSQASQKYLLNNFLLVVPKIALNRYIKCIFKMGAILQNSITDECLKQSKYITISTKLLWREIFRIKVSKGVATTVEGLNHSYLTVTYVHVITNKLNKY